MSKKTKKDERPQIIVDRHSEMGVVAVCPLCHQRGWRPTAREAWRWAYEHLKKHRTIHAARLAANAQLNISRQDRYDQRRSG